MIKNLPIAAFALPTASGSLESYIQTVNRFPLLSEEQEMRLARQLREHDDLGAARELVLSHLRLVVSIARGYLGYGLPHADLIQEGNVGLMKAVKRFDPDRGVRLVSFAVHWIRAEIHEYILRNWRMVKIATTKAQRKLFFNLRSMKKGLGSLSRDETEAMARQLNVKVSDVSEMEMRLGGQDLSLEPIGEDEEDGFGPISYLTNPDEEPGRILEHEQANCTIRCSAWPPCPTIPWSIAPTNTLPTTCPSRKPATRVIPRSSAVSMKPVPCAAQNSLPSLSRLLWKKPPTPICAAPTRKSSAPCTRAAS